MPTAKDSTLLLGDVLDGSSQWERRTMVYLHFICVKGLEQQCGLDREKDILGSVHMLHSLV